MPSSEVRDLRQLLLHRYKLVIMRARVKNELQHLCLNKGVQRKHKPWSQAGQQILRVKRHLVCKRWTIEKADENSNGIPWFVLHRPNSDKLRFHLPSLPWHWFDA